MNEYQRGSKTAKHHNFRCVWIVNDEVPYGFFSVSVAFDVILMIHETEYENDHHWSSSVIASEYDSNNVCSNQI